LIGLNHKIDASFITSKTSNFIHWNLHQFYKAKRSMIISPGNIEEAERISIEKRI